jgi:hypothetical protein
LRRDFVPLFTSGGAFPEETGAWQKALSLNVPPGPASPTQVIGVPVRAASAMAAFRAVFEGVTGRRGGSLMENSISWRLLHD